jgi:prepilin-type N-terminal cleavage/methylation domain-containing protein
MLTALWQSTRRRLGPQDGFTLVELMVAMACATVVMFGLTSIMIVTTRQTQSTFTRIDATRQGRTVFATIENELHSACVNGTPPIQGVTTNGTVESGANDLVFVSYFGTSANPLAVWHRLSFSQTARTLTDTSSAATYASTAAGGYWTQGAAISTVTLLSNVSAQSGVSVFQYFAYAQYPDASGNVYWAIPDGSTVNPLTGAALTIAPLGTTGGLSGANAAAVVEVTIDLLVGPTSSTLNNTVLAAAQDPVSDTISLRLTTPPDSTPAGTNVTSYAPCE